MANNEYNSLSTLSHARLVRTQDRSRHLVVRLVAANAQDAADAALLMSMLGLEVYSDDRTACHGG